jgi:hypothetical protein
MNFANISLRAFKMRPVGVATNIFNLQICWNWFEILITRLFETSSMQDCAFPFA